MSNAQLIVNQPGQASRRVDVSQKLVSIGRKPDNTVALAGDSNVSKYHAVIELRPDGFWLSDLGSSNGTFVNNQRVTTERKLSDGDLISVGGTSTVEFRAPNGRPASAPAGAGAPASAPPAAEAAAAGGAGAATAAAGSVASAAAPAASAAASASAPPQPAPSGGISPLLLIGGAVAGLAVVGALVFFLLGGFGGGSDAKTSKEKSSREQSAREKGYEGDELDALDEDELGDEKERADEDDPAADAPPARASEAAAPPIAPPLPDALTTAGSGAVGDMADKLAQRIGQKGGYTFDPQFVVLIDLYVRDYRTAAGYSERAARHRDAINSAFINEGLPSPFIGYVAAMSRTKFMETSAGGIWGLPPTITRDAADPQATARAAAVHMKELLNLFGTEHFMYAVACYGMPLDEAGRLQSELMQKDPTGQLRYDFWKMRAAGVVRPEQVERVARFLAAGIVGENPQRFGLRDQRLSSLY